MLTNSRLKIIYIQKTYADGNGEKKPAKAPAKKPAAKKEAAPKAEEAKAEPAKEGESK